MSAVFLYFFVTALGYFCDDWNCVCGNDGNTHLWILAKWKGVPVECKGPCPCKERCPTTDSSVCGKDGKTYRNKCVAGDDNVKCAGKCPCAPRPCSLNYDPVCGKDGHTYDNDCLAEEVGVACKGKCPCMPNGCPRHYRPVCGVNGKTYANDCVAGNEKIACRSKCPCRASDPFPVCASDGRTHRNYREAQQAGMQVECFGECPCGKEFNGCSMEIQPVCGYDSVSYVNECVARRQRVPVACRGLCPCTKEAISDYVDSQKPREVAQAVEVAAVVSDVDVSEVEVGSPDRRTQVPLVCDEDMEDFVCGIDGVGYKSRCHALVAGISVACAGRCPCPAPFLCPTYYYPVCGTNAHIYSNQCWALMHNVEVKCQGFCPCSQTTPRPGDGCVCDWGMDVLCCLGITPLTPIEMTL